MGEKSPFLGRSVGDRILLGALGLVMALVSWAMYLYFAHSAEGGLWRIVFLEISFLVLFLCVLAFIWAVAAPRFLEKLLWRTAVKVALIFFLLLIAVGVALAYFRSLK